MKRFLSHRMPHEYCRPAQRYQHEGQWLTALELSLLTGIPRSTIYARLRRGQPFDQPGKGGPVPKRYLFRGRMLTVPEVAKLTGLDKSTVYDRISGGRILEGTELRDANLSFQDLPSHARLITYKGRTLCHSQWAREFHISKHVFRARLALGWSMDRIAAEPVMSVPLRGLILRNHRAIVRMITAFRRARNHQLIHRICTGFYTGAGVPA